MNVQMMKLQPLSPLESLMPCARLERANGRRRAGVAVFAAAVALVPMIWAPRKTAAQPAAQTTSITTPTSTVNSPSPAPPTPTAPLRGGLPFGASKLPRELFGKPFTETKLEVSPESIVRTLTEARAGSMRVFLILVSSQRHYQNSDGSFNLDSWKARVARFRGVDFSKFIEDGTIIGHQLVSEAKARQQWGGKVIPNDVLDEMARYSKELWPTMSTMLRTDPSDLEKNAAGYQTPLPGWQWRHLDAASARYLARKGSVVQFAADEQASADRQNLALVVGLNVFSGGDGSSGIPSPAKGKWAMSPDELRQYGSTMLNKTTPCAFEMWRYETRNSEFRGFKYFRRPEISAVLDELAAIAAQQPARSCAKPVGK
jgi:hypothetical protein